MNSPAIPLSLLSQASSLEGYPYYSTLFPATSSSSAPSYQHPPRQTQFDYQDYCLDDNKFYPQRRQHVPHPYQVLSTPPSTSTAEDSNSGSGDGEGSSPFDDENQLPTPEEFRAIVDDYLNNLSPKKRDKALVDQHRYCLIQQVLKDPRNTAISTAQFRFWVKKMFQLQLGTMDIICHDNKPVAIKEHIYDILVRAHREAHHGGRDKTSALVRRKFSWIPKELVARFVRHCPFCITRRNGGQSPDPMRRNSPRCNDASIVVPTTTRHYSFDHYVSSSNIDPSSAATDGCNLSTSCDPPSDGIVYNYSTNYITTPYSTPSTSSRKFSCFSFDQEESDFLNSYPVEPVSSLASMVGFPLTSSTTINPSIPTAIPEQQKISKNNDTLLTSAPFSQVQQQHTLMDDTNVVSTALPPTSSFYQRRQQNYLYNPYTNNNCYANIVDMAPCDDGNDSCPLPNRQLQHLSSVSFPQSATQPKGGLMNHHHQNDQLDFYNNTHPLMTYPNPISDSVASAATSTVFGSADL